MVKRAEKEVDYTDHTRVVFLGKTGNGKSSSINNLIGTKFFESKVSSKSVTYNCQAVATNVADEKYLVVDTPGLFDTERKQNEIFEELKNVMEFTYPGIDAFVIVISITRFTEEEQKTIEFISKFFGKSINDYGVVLFTRLDDLERDGMSLDSFIRDNEKLNKFVNDFGRRYIGFNNTLGMQSEQLKRLRKELIDKIKYTKNKNNGICYSTQIFESSQKAFKLELERIARLDLTIEELNKHIDDLKKKHQDDLSHFQEKTESMVNQMKIDADKKSQEIKEMKRKIEEEKSNSQKILEEFEKRLKKRDRKIEKLTENKNQVGKKKENTVSTNISQQGPIVKKDEQDFFTRSTNLIKDGVDLVENAAGIVIDIAKNVSKMPSIQTQPRGCF